MAETLLQAALNGEPIKATEDTPLLEALRSKASTAHQKLFCNSCKVCVFETNDPEDPRNFSLEKKLLLLGPLILIDLSVSWGASAFSPASGDFAEDMGIDASIALLGLCLYVIGMALGPMGLAPLSEYYGRNPLYIISYGFHLVLIAAYAVVDRLEIFLTLRLFSGCFSSVTVANLGGTIADLYPREETGYAMSVFLWASTAGSPTGYFLFSFIAQGHCWRSVFWALFGLSAVFWIIMTAALTTVGETRHSVILRRRAARERKETGVDTIDVPDECKTRNFKDLFGNALTLPFRFLFTEAIISFCAAYNGYLFGLSFLFNQAFARVFGADGYGFSTSGIGLAFLGIIIGISAGPLTNIMQEKWFRMKTAEGAGRIQPEARVQLAQVAAVVFPSSLLCFAWTGSTSIHPLAPMIASSFWGWSFYSLILMTYTYTEDAYGTYSASAFAGQGLVRNLMGGTFPLFGTKLYDALGNQWAGTTLALCGLLLVPIPFVLEKYGQWLRKRSPWARQQMESEES